MLRRRLQPLPVWRHRGFHQHSDQAAFGEMARFIRSNPSASEVQQAGLSGAAGSDGTQQHQQSRADTGSTRYVRDDLSERDPLGGAFHRDYHRDPVAGFDPHYAPRNFAQGGRLQHHYPLSPLSYEEQATLRGVTDHDAMRSRFERAGVREALRGVPGEDAARFLQSRAEEHAARHQTSPGRHESLAPWDIAQTHATEQLTQTEVPTRSASDLRHAREQHPLARNSVDGHRLVETMRDQQRLRGEQYEEEAMRQIHGLRAKERFENERTQSMQRTPFRGFDLDRTYAQRQGALYGQITQFQPMVPPAGIGEELRNVRASAVPADVETAAKVLALNTTSQTPRVGEDLTEHIVETLHASKRNTQRAQEKAYRERMGMGRQAPLVTEAGPDRRTQKMHKNDERLLQAARFNTWAYKDSEVEDHRNPYERNNTEYGVGHLLRTRFDIDRREAQKATGAQDVTERRTVFYGIPIAQQLDQYVQMRRGARGERHMDFFLPTVSHQDMQLAHASRDLEGFPMLKQRPDTYEWELFVRYRAHHQQRRQLALRHGLEPVPNETREERDVRRAKLDELCEATPFDTTQLRYHADEMRPSAEALRQWFGQYVLPSPTVAKLVVGAEHAMPLHMAPAPIATRDGTATNEVDNRENLLSSRYFEKLLMNDAYNMRTGRGYLTDVSGRIPEPDIPLRLPPEALKHFTAQEVKMYNEYVKLLTDRHRERHERARNSPRWLEAFKQHGVVSETHARVEVVTLQSCVEPNKELLVGVAEYASEIDATAGTTSALLIDGEEYKVKPGSRRFITPLSVRLDDGSTTVIDDEYFMTCPLQHSVDDPNAMLNFGLPPYHYNRTNYIETQDVIWEERTYEQQEGWSPALHCDGLKAGLPVRAQRRFGSPTSTPSSGTFHRAVIVNYFKQPFYNPNPRTVTVQFVDDGAVEDVPLEDVMIWQYTWGGPDRTLPDESRRTIPSTRRFVDFADPLDEKGDGGEPHFLERYAKRDRQSRFRSVRQITDLDSWNVFDLRRSANHRLLSSSHRRDYVRAGYFNRYTPWEWILHQEADQPLIKEQLRSDDVGPSYFFAPNRFWRYKRRPHGYIRNFREEVRDMFAYVDTVTPWKKAQKIRTFAEVREHHPVPIYNRPQVAPHRNTPGLLPSHMWETDKRTGNVKFLKDSVRDYKTTTPYPAWVQL